MNTDPTKMQPFEICSIRPPTENYSLTFRLTRNCYWNRCAFCPVYKFGARFSRRSMEEVMNDIAHARMLYDLMSERNILEHTAHDEAYQKVQHLADEIISLNPTLKLEHQEGNPRQDLDPKLEWFLSWFKDKPGIKDSLENLLIWHMSGGETCFLGDADSLILKPDFLGSVIKVAKESFPTLQRYTVYGRTRSAARSRKLSELQAYRNAGLHRVHFGLESGSDAVLKLVKKGETRTDHIEGGLKTRDAGLSVSFYLMPGLGGVDLSGEHALQTADVINRVSPDFLRLRSLQIFPQTPLEERRNKGQFVELNEHQLVSEIRLLIDSINTPTQLYSDSAVNLVQVNGLLPEEKPEMLAKLDEFLNLSQREQLIYSFKNRISAFLGQYGGLTQDIYQMIAPFLHGQDLDYGAMSNRNLKDSIRLIRSKLMP